MAGKKAGSSNGQPRESREEFAARVGKELREEAQRVMSEADRQAQRIRVEGRKKAKEIRKVASGLDGKRS
jgi:regulator of protease activity HflC (stomatin/prohibitin superfamily)